MTTQSVAMRVAITTDQNGNISDFVLSACCSTVENMDTSWLSNTSSGVFNYLYKHITGEDDSARPPSSLDVLSKANVWITDLPTNNYEPLEASHGARRQAKKVGVSFFFEF